MSKGEFEGKVRYDVTAIISLFSLPLDALTSRFFSVEWYGVTRLARVVSYESTAMVVFPRLPLKLCPLSRRKTHLLYLSLSLSLSLS